MKYPYFIGYFLLLPCKCDTIYMYKIYLYLFYIFMEVFMKALALHPFYAAMVAVGEKKIEYRSWNTNYRGDLLICSTLKKDLPVFPRGHALAIVTIDKTVQTKKGWSWHLKNVRPIIPIPVKCQQRIFDIDVNVKELKIDDKLFLFDFWESTGLVSGVSEFFGEN